MSANIRRRSQKELAYCTGATSRTQWPKAPNVTEELRISVLFVSMTLSIAMSPITGDEIVVTRRNTAATIKQATPDLSQLIQVSSAAQ